MTISLPYLDRLDPEHQKVFSELRSFKDRFVLAGGTAIMLQIGHRRSFDFDCFTQTQLADNLRTQVRRQFAKPLLPIVDSSEQLSFKTSQRIEITFVYYPHRPLRSPIKTTSIPLFHLDDLVANKAYTLGRRGAWRDYVDLFFFLKWKIYDLPAIVSLTEKKFSGEFNSKLFLEQLVYFDDLNLVPTAFLKESYTDSQIQSFLSHQVKEYLKILLP